jgi:hypothetical protein
MTPEEKAEQVYVAWVEELGARPVDEWPQVAGPDRERLVALIAEAIREAREWPLRPAEDEIRPVFQTGIPGGGPRLLGDPDLGEFRL